MKKINSKEYNKILIEILDYIHNICKKNNIKYSLMYGSLIGAVRHKGIIPWDDDIDVVFDKENYDKFLKVINKDDNSRFALINDKNNSSYYLPFDKVIDKTTIATEIGRRKIDGYGVFVDIFVFHNMPNNEIIGKLHYKRIVFWQNLIFGYSNSYLGKNHIFLKKIRRSIALKLGINYILKKYNKLLSKYDNKNTKFAITSWPDFGYDHEVVKKEWLNKYSFVEFDIIESMVYEKYDEILTKTYGDYMTLPSKEKRVSQHNMDAYLKVSVNPLISCIITTYRRPTKVLKRAIDSVLNQTYKNIELIVVNDYPEDKTLSKQIKDLIGSYKNNKIKYICLDKNSGSCFARNKGAESSKGEYLAFLDDDDEWLPNKIDSELKEFVNPEIGIVYCDNYIVKNNSKKLHIQVNPNTYNDDYKQILEGNFLGGVSFPLIKSKCFFEVGGFDNKLESQQDTDLWIRLIKKHKAVKCNEPLLNYYISDYSITNNLTKKLNGYKYILNKYEKDYKKYKDVLINKYLIIGDVFTSYGDFKTANEFYSNAKKLGVSRFRIIKRKSISLMRFLKHKIV